MVAAGHAAGIKVSISLATNETALGSIVNSPTLLPQLITNVVNMVETYNADGIVVDWEKAGTTQAQANLLITDLYAALHPLNKLISFAGCFRQLEPARSRSSGI